MTVAELEQHCANKKFSEQQEDAWNAMQALIKESGYTVNQLHEDLSFFIRRGNEAAHPNVFTVGGNNEALIELLLENYWDRDEGFPRLEKLVKFYKKLDR